MWMNTFTLTNAVGASGFLLSLVAYCLIRRIIANGATPGRLRCNARICFIVGLLKMGVGIFEIIYFTKSGGTWWGWILILFSIFWLVRGNKFRRQARTISAGYQYFNNGNVNDDGNNNNQRRGSSDINNSEQPQRRLSNAPQIVVVSDQSNPNHPNSSFQPNASASIVQGGVAPNALSQPMMSAYDAPLIRNAVKFHIKPLLIYILCFSDDIYSSLHIIWWIYNALFSIYFCIPFCIIPC